VQATKSTIDMKHPEKPKRKTSRTWSHTKYWNWM